MAAPRQQHYGDKQQGHRQIGSLRTTLCHASFFLRIRGDCTINAAIQSVIMMALK
jgi:hypothetical protein